MKGTLKSINFESDSKGADACKQDLYLFFCEVSSLIQNLIITKIQISHVNSRIPLGMFHRKGWQFKLPRKDTNYLVLLLNYCIILGSPQPSKKKLKHNTATK